MNALGTRFGRATHLVLGLGLGAQLLAAPAAYAQTAAAPIDP